MGLFGRGKEKPAARTAGGSDILRHGEAQPIDAADAAFYGEEIEAWMDTAFPGRSTSVWHELASPDIHVDVYVMEPTQQEPYYVLYTVGMSALPMMLENIAHPDQYGYLRRAELMMYLPAGFPLDQLRGADGGDAPEEAYWPVRVLKSLARLPHQYHTWLGTGHSVPNGDPAQPFAGTGFTGVVLFLPDEGNGPKQVLPVPTKDGGQVMLYLTVPVYPEEMAVKLRRGADTLEGDLLALGGGRGFMADPARPNTSPRESRP